MAMLPASGGGDGGSGSSDGKPPPRGHLTPQSYEDILKFAVENTVPGDEPAQPLPDEKKVWLDQALASMFTDEVKILRVKLTELEGIDSDREEDIESKSALLDYIGDLCDDIDNAKGLIKIGGQSVLFRCLDDRSSDIRWRALHVMATILQNNEFVQDHLLKEHAIQRFLQIADSDQSDTVKIKAIYALSCHVREHNPSGEAFVEADGFSCLVKAMQSQNEKLQIKAAFLLKGLLIAQPKFKAEAQRIGMVQQLVDLLNRDHTATHEHMMAALLCLATDHPQSVEDCRQSQYGLKELLKGRMELIGGKEEFQEEYQYCQDLLALVFPPSEESSVER